MLSKETLQQCIGARWLERTVKGCDCYAKRAAGPWPKADQYSPTIFLVQADRFWSAAIPRCFIPDDFQDKVEGLSIEAGCDILRAMPACVEDKLRTYVIRSDDGPGPRSYSSAQIGRKCSSALVLLVTTQRFARILSLVTPKNIFTTTHECDFIVLAISILPDSDAISYLALGTQPH